MRLARPREVLIRAGPRTVVFLALFDSGIPNTRLFLDCRVRSARSQRAMANPIPTGPPLSVSSIATLIPTTSPRTLNNGPPEFPRLIDASV